MTQTEVASELITRITADYGDLHGVIHSAGLLKDNYLMNKTNEELKQVLAPKVKGLVNVDKATEHLALDFFILSLPYLVSPALRDRRITQWLMHLWTAMPLIVMRL